MREKILILTPFYPPNIGGVETFCKNLVKELSRQYDTKVCTINWRGQKLFKGTGIKQFLDIFPRLFPKFLIQLEASKFKTVYAQGFNAAFIGALCKKAYGYKLFVTTHAFYNFKNRSSIFRCLAKKILNKADKIFIEGENVKQDILTLKIDKNKLVPYCHWCDQEVFKPKKQEHEGLVILCAGRLDLAEKGADIIREVENQLQEKEIKFEYIKNVPHENMPAYFQMADIVILPSVFSESFPVVVIEAASCGCAIITSNKGSLPELVENFGYTIDPTADNFKKFIEFLDRNRSLLKRIQNKALDYALKNFSPKNAEVFL